MWFKYIYRLVLKYTGKMYALERRNDYTQLQNKNFPSNRSSNCERTTQHSTEWKNIIIIVSNNTFYIFVLCLFFICCPFIGFQFIHTQFTMYNVMYMELKLHFIVVVSRILWFLIPLILMFFPIFLTAWPAGYPIALSSLTIRHIQQIYH